MKPVITADNISKRYRIGGPVERHDTFGGQLLSMIRQPLRNFQKLRNLDRFNEDESTIFWALRDISFEVRQGEVLGIIGHNGAGKSTLLKILSRITEPTTGTITIRGRVSSLLEVGTGFHPDLSGRDNIYMNGTLLGMSKREIDRKLEQIIEFSGISRHIDTPVKRYSSGMTVRLAFSVAAHLEPEILIIDEVLAVGDQEFQKKCLGKMQEVSGHGRTVLYVSHNMPTISTFCSSCIWLHSGKIIDRGSPAQIVSKYLNYYSSRKLMTEWVGSKAKNLCYFERIIVCSSSGEYFDMTSCIKFHFELFSEIELNGFQVSLKIYDENYSLVSWIYNSDFLIPFELKIGRNHFSYTIPENNLLPGKYYFTFQAMYNYGQEIFDEVVDAISIEVHPSDVSGSGRPFLKDRGMVWLKLN